MARLVSDNRWQPHEHLLLVNSCLCAVESGRIKNLIVTMPPQYGKSELGSMFFPAWYLCKHPDRRIILASYEADFAATWGRRAREVMEEAGPTYFGLQVSKESHAAKRWDITGHMGGMSTAGVDGPITGKGAYVFIVDDPIKGPNDAASATLRQKAWDWYESVVKSRMHKDGSKIIYMTRWHEDDLVGKIIHDAETGGEPYFLLRLPEEAEEDEKIGEWKRKKGQILCPAMHSQDQVNYAKRNPYWFAALRQQRPAPMGGGIFKRKWFKYYQITPRGFIDCQSPNIPVFDPMSLLRFFTVDLAISKKETAHFTVMGCWGYDFTTRNLFLLGMERDRWDGPEILEELERFHGKWHPSFVGIETVQFQSMMAQFSKKRGMRVRALEPGKADKVTRAIEATPMFKEGRVWFPFVAPWLVTVENELLVFNKGEYDDIVDMVSYGVYVVESNKFLGALKDGPRMPPTVQSEDQPRETGVMDAFKARGSVWDDFINPIPWEGIQVPE